MPTIKITRAGRYGGQKKSATISESASLVDLFNAIEARGVAILPVSHQPGSEIMGRGLSGGIHQATADVGTILAFKQGVPSKRECDDDTEQDWYSLATELTVLQHPPIRENHCIINLLGITFSVDDKDVLSGGRAWPVLVTRKASLGHMGAALLNPQSPISAKDRLKFFAEASEAVFLLHHCGVAHGDIKPDNFVIDQDEDENNCKLIDFGSCVIKGQNRQPTSNAPWNPPELADNFTQGFVNFEALSQADLFSLGLVLVHILLPTHALRSAKASFLREELSDQGWERIVLELEQSKSQSSEISLASRLDHAISKAEIPVEQKAVLSCIVQRTVLPLTGSRSMPWNEIFDLAKDYVSTELKLGLEGTQPTAVEPPPLTFNSPSIGHEKHAIFGVKKLLGELDDTDYAVRQTLLRAMERKAQSSSCIECRKQYSFQVALCYEIGFGNPVVHSQRIQFLITSGLSQINVDNAIDDISRNYHGTNRVSTQVLEQLVLPVLQASNRPVEYQESRRLATAEASLKMELQARIRAFGPGHRCLARFMEELAQVVLRQSKWSEAAKYQQQAAEILRTYGENHPSYLYARLKLADIWYEQGFLSKAERVQQDCIPQLKSVVGQGHPEVLAAMVVQAKTKVAQGALDEAESIMQEAVSFRTRTLAPNHPLTITAELSLVAILGHGGNTRKATELMRGIEEKMSNMLYGDTIRKVELYLAQAALYEDMSHLDMAMAKVEMIQASLDRQRIGDEDHLRLWAYQVEASIHHAGRRWPQEEILLRRIVSLLELKGETIKWPQQLLVDNLVLQGHLLEAMAILENIERDLGPSPLTSDPSRYLACHEVVSTILHLQGRVDEAQEKLTSLLETCKLNLGENHATTTDAAMCLAIFWAEQHQFEKAQTQYELLLTNLRKHPGKRIVRVARELAVVYKERGLFTEAIEACFEGLKWASEAGGENSIESLAVRIILGSIYVNMEEWDKAEVVLAEVDAKCRDIRRSSSIKSSLHLLRRLQGRFQEALQLATEAQKLWGECTHVETSESLLLEGNVLRCRLDAEGLTTQTEMEIQKIIHQRESTHWFSHPANITLMADIADIYSVSGRLQQAKDLFDKIESLGGLEENDKPIQYATLLGKRAYLCVRLGHLADAEVNEREALRARERIFPSGHHVIIATKENLASTLSDQGKYAEAEALLREAVNAYDSHVQRASKPSDVAKVGRKTAWAKKNLGGVLFLQGKMVESLCLFSEALEISLAVGAMESRVEELRTNIALVQAILSNVETTKQAHQGEA
ncbi:Serine/threonine protein kinase [Fusarium sp. LHS14.1]|nr:Serine/threonine protein kinase [Fusarium sp. LHS14.1]